MLTSRLTFVDPSASTVLPSACWSSAWFTDGFKWVVAIMILVAFSATQPAFSQAVSASNEQQVTALLAEIEAQNKTRSVFAVNSRRKIAEVPFDAGFRVVKNMGKWRVVEFNQPMVPGWASSDYLIVSKGQARVATDRLNMRLNPSVSAPVLLQLTRDYIGIVSARKNGFMRLRAPSSFQVAIFSGTDSEAESIVFGQLSVISTSTAVKPVITEVATEVVESRSRDQLEDLQPVVNQQSIIKALPQAQASENATDLTRSERLHVIAPGDSLSLLVFGEDDLSIQNVRVPQSGRVSFPLIGSMLVAGRTTPQVEKSVAELLAGGYVKNPRLSVTMFSYRPIFIRGAVQQTGSFPFSEGLTISKAIAIAGGSKKSAKRQGVSILREGTVIEQALTIDSQIEVQSGDVISLEEEFGVQESDAAYIYLHGEVASPGEYQFRRGLTVEKAIVLAGGFTLRGSAKKISVTRYADIEADQQPEKLKKVKLYAPIKPGDIINVGATWF